MTTKKEDFLKRLLATFRVEADEHIKALTSGLLQLEKNLGAAEMARVIDLVYREAHSLKGAARSVDIGGIERVCQYLESVFKRFKHTPAVRNASVFDILHRAIDIIDELNRSGKKELPQLDNIINDLTSLLNGPLPDASPSNFRPAPQPHSVELPLSPVTPEPAGDNKRQERIQILKNVEGRLNRLRQSEAENQAAEPLAPDKAPPDAHETTDAFFPKETGLADARTATIRLPAEKMDLVMLQAEELIYGKLSLNRLSAGLHDLEQRLENLQKFSLDELRPGVKNLRGHIRSLIKSMETDRRTMNALIDTHLEDMKELLMLPFSTISDLFSKTVRDLARDKGKRIDFSVRGADNLVDKRVLESIKTPLLHLVRNAVDHGVEPPQDRQRFHKKPTGEITLEISQIENGKIEVLLGDDGRGIDLERVKTHVLESGLAPETKVDKMSETELLDFIFYPEFSTSPLITDISGRGLGLAIAREIVERLGGEISVSTRHQKGAVFRLILPVTLSTFRGVLVKCGDSSFIIPTFNIERVLRVSLTDIKTVENRETIIFDELPISYLPLARVLRLPTPEKGKTNRAYIQVLVLGGENKRIAFGIDEVQDEEEVLVKSLGKQLKRVYNISGAAILSSTDVVPILNPAELIKSAILAADSGGDVIAPSVSPSGKKTKTVLLVEDSITSRILLKNILESAGYHVRVAVDGVDGWTTIKENSADIVISDVDMPRMNGFQLTRKIRQDKQLADTPVILVTGLESREDKEMGIEVGANAYIVKSSFDQSNLLGVLKQLI